MAILDHLIVPSRNRRVSAEQLAGLLGVRWEPDSMGMFSAVHVNDGLTIDYGNADADFDIHHYCFRVTEEEFDAIYGRIQEQGISYRSSPHGPMDMQIDDSGEGRILYWFDPDGHNWEILTVSYAR